MSVQKSQQNTKEDSKTGKKKKKINIAHTENNEKNGNDNYVPISNYFKCKYIKFHSQKTEWLDGFKKKKMDWESEVNRCKLLHLE